MSALDIALKVAQIASPFLAAGVAVLGFRLTIGQKDRHDRRSEWWRRAAWALEHIDNTDDTDTLGWSILDALSDSDLATSTEQAIIEAIATQAVEDALATEAGVEDNETQQEGDGR
ncbi:hypothetical protein [Gordonia humi]|uniref:Uncharacterized protein n=1 Tax=Gordonia humi TaxID=686429 RepID=A0A840F357_9ACTN|nr:hypothetical protein [Gordonia humi]MBB4134007.1 hypothetical protein [Gordonia humi]